MTALRNLLKYDPRPLSDFLFFIFIFTVIDDEHVVYLWWGLPIKSEGHRSPSYTNLVPKDGVNIFWAII